MRIKICGITKPDQGQVIADLGATALGLMCVSSSPRYVSISQIQAVIAKLSNDNTVDTIGVVANAPLEEIKNIVRNTGLTGIQLHGDETAEFCHQLKENLPNIEVIKALRIRGEEDLEKISDYVDYIDTFLLDAYHPQQLGGTGKTLDWKILKDFNPGRPWFLAGGLKPDNILDALEIVSPNGIDLSSGVETTPGDKDLDKVRKLFEKLKYC
jgi:phosphoribosylanthranilate isomerase